MGTFLRKKLNVLPRYLLLIVFGGALLTVITDSSAADNQNTPPQQDQAVSSQTVAEPSTGPIGTLLDAFTGTTDDASKSGFAEIGANLPQMLPDQLTSFTNVSKTKSASRAFGFLIAVIVLLGVVFVIEKWLVRRLSRKYLHVDVSGAKEAQATNLLDKLSAGLMHIIPELLGIAIFLGSAVAGYALIFRGTNLAARVVFVALLLCVVCYRVAAIVAELLFAPKAPDRRLLPFTDATATILRHLSVRTITYIFSVLILAAAFIRLGAQPITTLMFKVVAATLLLVAVAVIAVRKRQYVADYILTPSMENQEPPSPARKNLAEIWHLLFILYCIFLWIMLVNSTADPSSVTKGAFLMSFFILPIWVVLDWLLLLIVKNGLSILKIDIFDAHEHASVRSGALKKTLFGARTFLIVVLAAWLFHLWGYNLPFVSVLSKAIFDSLLIFAIALGVWRLVSNWIEAKIAAEAPVAEEEDDSADEMGGGVARGRAYTLLPILRKFIGTVLGVMVTLTVLSSLGVDIGPLLAGAGVIGLAVGFGAQKVVADILSGFFYLFDDAFRVGEYLQAGSVSGTVESISLRNVMLRHHRGMLQIIPYSELGTITNFMRGGIIEKFNLDFPYDTDIDKVRKIIKNVGIEMMADPEFADDFLQPLKSQGVREIANSVMTIRVKFTAKPRRQFLIRREAFKRITQALSAKGIHYAHRKIIVDIPNIDDGQKDQAETVRRAAGAAAQQILEEEAEAQKLAAQKKK
jgi:small-conductance mechanosensitive channel